MIADDLFAGAGGWDLAAAELGIVARGIENMPQARATRDAAGLHTIHDDVWTYEPDGRAEGLIASPPCQTFSAAGKGAGRRALGDVLALARDLEGVDLREASEQFEDERTALVLMPLWRAIHGSYHWLAWEQVPTVLPVWEACAEVLRQLGWSAWAGLLHAEQYGVPQTRKRAFLLASLDREVGPPQPTHSRYHSRDPKRLDQGVKPWVSMAEAFGWRSPGVEWVLRNNSSAKAAERAPDQPAPTLYFGQRSNYCAWEWRGVGIPPALPEWAFNRPSTTIVGSFKPEVVAAPGYRTTVSRQDAPDSVRVTVAEAGVLQSFPATFPWQGAKGKQYLQCGNAVPPLMAGAALSAASGIQLGHPEGITA